MRLLFVLCIAALSFGQSAKACEDSSPVHLQEYRSRSGVSRGTVLFVHGLNNNGAIFEAFKSSLQQAGFDIAFLTLTAHSGNDSDKFCATVERYVNDFKQALRYLLNRYPEKDVYVVGYSLGGAVSTLGLKEFPQGAVSKMVLMAPALSVHSYIELVRLAFPFAWTNLSLPSLAPAQYTAYESTAVRSYRASFRTMEQAHEYLESTPELPPTLVLIHQEDELVSPAGLEDIISDYSLTHWTLEQLDYKKADEDYTFHHLFAPEAFAKEDFLDLQQKIVRHFSADF
jgi:pimeloyl-ACP methyl ester carboxylesterase